MEVDVERTNKITVFRRIQVLEKDIRTGPFLVHRRQVNNVRKNARSDYLNTCDFCLRKIDKPGEASVEVFDYITFLVFFFHEACYERSLSCIEKENDDDWTI